MGCTESRSDDESLGLGNRVDGGARVDHVKRPVQQALAQSQQQQQQQWREEQHPLRQQQPSPPLSVTPQATPQNSRSQIARPSGATVHTDGERVSKAVSMTVPPQDGPRKGQKLLDKYVLGKVLGQGAFGVVYKCRRKGTTQDFAVKMIDQVETPLAEIEREVQVLQVLKHPCVIRLHDVFYEKVFVCIVLELYKGGDMIQGMMRHWKAKGMIPMGPVRHLTQQMWQAVAFIHSRCFLHRDVKGDNFMMDHLEVEHPQQRIYLSDFGTVIEVKPGERKSGKCGTKNYWSPEFYKQNYAHKVDCWATGVIMFGFFSGKFPFKSEEEVKHKQLQVHTRVGEEGEQLIRWALERDEKKRCEAAQAAQHPWISSKAQQPQISAQESAGFNPEIKEFGANAGVVQRRQELVDRLVRSAHQAIQGQATRVQSITSGYRDGSLNVRQLDDDTFSITDKHTERTTAFQWTPVEQARQHLNAYDGIHAIRSGVVNNEVSSWSVRQMLKTNDVSLDLFGKGKAKPLEEFVEEVQRGKARLLIDATKPKCLVRVVDVVLLRIFVKTGAGRRYLVESKQQYPDGRVVESCRLPGHMKAPHENVMQTAERLVREMLQMKDCRIIFEFSHIDRQEVQEDSASYPGVQTVYSKETVTGVMTVHDPMILERVGIADKAVGGSTGFDVQDSQRYLRGYQWMSEAECLAKGIMLRPSVKDEEISVLVYPPVGLNEEALMEYLANHDIDVSRWGVGTARSIADFSEELVKGESTLTRLKTNGRIVRLVDIVVLKIIKAGVQEEYVLREVEESIGDVTKDLDRLPAMKRRSDEHPFAAARRLISRYLAFDENTVNIDPDDVRIVEEEQESTSYPGLLSVYRKRYMSATMRFTSADAHGVRQAGRKR